MRAMRTMEPMQLSDLDVAPFRVEQRAILPGSPERVFAELAEPAAWVAWFPLMREARWTSEVTAAPGATRQVRLRLLGRFDERFLAWEPGRRFAFTMTGSTSPLARRMAEDWRLAPAGADTELTWIIGGHPSTLGRAASSVVRLTTRRMFRGGVANLERRLAARRTV